MKPNLEAVAAFLKDEYASEGAARRSAPLRGAPLRGAPLRGAKRLRGALLRFAERRFAGRLTAASRRAAGFEITGTESNSLHVTLPATTENLTEVLAELSARFGIEADLSLTPAGANLVLWVPAGEPEPEPEAKPPGGGRVLVGGLLLGMAAVGWAHAALPSGAGAPPPLPSNWSSYIWPW